MQEVPPRRFFFVHVTQEPETVLLTEVRKQNLARGSPRSFFFTSRSLQNQSQILIVLQTNKALPDEGQQLNYKFDTDQDRVLIMRLTGYRTR